MGNKVILRPNSGNTFTLFPETQPRNWVDHIVETTRFIRIRKIPQVLTAIGTTKEVIEQNYQGKSASNQKRYMVPTGADDNTGVITNILLRLCLTGQGENQPLAIRSCNWCDPKQIFKLALRTTGRRA